MKHKNRRLYAGAAWLALFALWTGLIQTVDVRGIGPYGAEVGFASLNGWFHEQTGVHMTLYHITDWLGLVPLCVCMLFGSIGLMQWIKRKRLFKVDLDLLILGVYYIIVLMCYLAFEIIPVNYRPVLIEGRMEASYPSSTTLLVLSVMPTFCFQIRRRWKNLSAKRAACTIACAFSACVVLGRLASGVHWLTDIAGAVLLSGGLFRLYEAAAIGVDPKQ